MILSLNIEVWNRTIRTNALNDQWVSSIQAVVKASDQDKATDINKFATAFYNEVARVYIPAFMITRHILNSRSYVFDELLPEIVKTIENKQNIHSMMHNYLWLDCLLGSMQEQYSIGYAKQLQKELTANKIGNKTDAEFPVDITKQFFDSLLYLRTVLKTHLFPAEVSAPPSLV